MLLYLYGCRILHNHTCKTLYVMMYIKVSFDYNVVMYTYIIDQFPYPASTSHVLELYSNTSTTSMVNRVN